MHIVLKENAGDILLEHAKRVPFKLNDSLIAVANTLNMFNGFALEIRANGLMEYAYRHHAVDTLIFDDMVAEVHNDIRSYHGFCLACKKVQVFSTNMRCRYCENAAIENFIMPFPVNLRLVNASDGVPLIIKEPSGAQLVLTHATVHDENFFDFMSHMLDSNILIARDRDSRIYANHIGYWGSYTDDFGEEYLRLFHW